MREELDAIPRDGGGVCIPGVWIEAAMKEERPILRLVLDDDFAARAERERMVWCDQWIEENLAPLIATLNPELEHVVGMDYARHRHFTGIAPLEIGKTLNRRAPFLIELQNVPTRQQEQILWALIEGLPKWRGTAIDATGPGQTIAEYTADKFGHSRVHQVVLSRAWYGLWMPKFIDSFQDGTIDLPRDANTEADLRAIERVNGVPMVADLSAADMRDLKDPELFRHGDMAIALCLAWFASLNKSGPIEFQSLGQERIGLTLDDYIGERTDFTGFM
jgi:phage FluMu gp28-like protein